MARRLVALSCMILGIGIFLYPTVKDRYETHEQQKILSEWQDNLKELEQPDPQIDSEPDAAREQAVNTVPVSDETQPQQPQTEPALKKIPPQYKPEGVLTIDKINLKLPILTGATKAHMLVSVASIAHTGKPGEVGNYAIAGHRNLTYGKNFNRLDEMKVGDLIKVDTGTKQFIYKVDQKLYVKPTDVWVLEGNGKDREITLVTCHPMGHPTHRLIVKGKLVETKDSTL
ncbi:class D sortase [Paenibacillus humicola]|uniref:class D sortase n=1 Tax=Paenibacillus humicola TaxID=3110540 RepID=UPI00237AB5C9|nr:class D sortase [Paenibacillus humicola]